MPLKRVPATGNDAVYRQGSSEAVGSLGSPARTGGHFAAIRMFFCTLSIVALALVATPAAAAPEGLLVRAGPGDAIALEDFAGYSLGTFPQTWRVRGSANQAATIYRVARENEAGSFLAARADGDSVMIGLDREFEPARYPYLRWRWRVHTFPSGGDERDRSTNDSAAGVYVIFPGRWPFLPRVLKYVWSTSAPVGLRKPSPMYNDTKIIVVASGPANEPEQWRTETVNVRQDYEALFGREAPTARGIGLLTDADATGSVAAADYTGFELLNSVRGCPDDGSPSGEEPLANSSPN